MRKSPIDGCVGCLIRRNRELLVMAVMEEIENAISNEASLNLLFYNLQMGRKLNGLLYSGIF